MGFSLGDLGLAGLSTMVGGPLAGLKALGTLTQVDAQQQKAALMRQEATLHESALEETMRRMEGSQTQILSSTKARMAASGFDSGSSSFDSYLSGMAKQFGFQDQTAFSQGEKSIALQREAADITGDTDAMKYLGLANDTISGATDTLKMAALFA